MVLDVPAEDVADADVFQIEAFGQELGLGAFPAALDALMMYLRIPSPALVRWSWMSCPVILSASPRPRLRCACPSCIRADGGHSQVVDPLDGRCWRLWGGHRAAGPLHA